MKLYSLHSTYIIQSYILIILLLLSWLHCLYRHFIGCQYSPQFYSDYIITGVTTNQVLLNQPMSPDTNTVAYCYTLLILVNNDNEMGMGLISVKAADSLNVLLQIIILNISNITL